MRRKSGPIYNLNHTFDVKVIHTVCGLENLMGDEYLNIEQSKISEGIKSEIKDDIIKTLKTEYQK